MTDIPVPGVATSNARAMSLLQAAEERRDKREQNLFLDVPSWDGDLVAEYAVIPKHELKEMGERQLRSLRHAQNGQDADRIRFDIELIVRACEGLHALDPNNGDRVPLEDENGNVGYGRIGALLGKPDIITDSTIAVLYLMGTRDYENNTWEENTMAVTTHARAISRWMSDPSKRTFDLEALLGEL